MKYFPQTSADITDMLKVVGVGSLDELFAEIPEELKLHHSLNLPKAQSEMEVRKTISTWLLKTKLSPALPERECTTTICQALFLILRHALNFPLRTRPIRRKYHKERFNIFLNTKP